MIPADSMLGLPQGLLRPWAVLALLTCAAGTLAVALWPSRRRARPRRGPSLLAIGLAALAVRAALSLVQDGGLYDVFDAYRIVGGQLREGGDIFVEPALGLANYPPVIYWWWAAASAIGADHPHLYAAAVRAPFWAADAVIAPLIALLVRRTAAAGSSLPSRAGWAYALCPVAAAVPTLHGQFEPLVLIALVGAVAVLRERPPLAGLLLGIAVAFKPWPLFFIVPLLALVPRSGRLGFLAALAAPPLAAFALYGLVHPEHLAAGIRRVATYVAHRQGLGTSFLFGDRAPVWQIVAMNLLAGAAASVAGLVAGRRGRQPAEAVALAMLVLLALSPTVSDQYLVWPLPLLLLAGRVRAAALLTAGLLPAVIGLDLWTSQNDGGTPEALLVLATASLAATAVLICSGRRAEPARAAAAT